MDAAGILLAKSKRVAQEHPELFHYTTAAGLYGIIQSQQLRATNIGYLNDAEEHIGFFSRRLLKLLDDPVRRAVAEMSKNAAGQRRLEEVGGPEAMVEGLKVDLRDTLSEVSLKLNSPYVTAFCSAKAHKAQDDGLLSQWRAYGVDGGYAIAFRTSDLEKMLEEEAKRFHYQFGLLGDVDYHEDDENASRYPETARWEAMAQTAVFDFLVTEKPESTEPLAESISALSCRYKHNGFREEAEVRIVTMPSNDDLYEMTHSKGDKRPRKPILFAPRNGVLVPYVMLFGQSVDGRLEKLPVTKVIVGPHPDREKRRKAVQIGRAHV